MSVSSTNAWAFLTPWDFRQYKTYFNEIKSKSNSKTHINVLF